MDINVMLVVLIVAAGLFLLLRELWCWYWKINAALEVLRDMQRLLKNIEKNTGGGAEPEQAESALAGRRVTNRGNVT